MDIKLQEKILKMLFKQEPFLEDKKWFLQLYSDIPRSQGSLIHELSHVTPIGEPVEIFSWNYLPGSINGATITRPAVTNNRDIIFSDVPEGISWKLDYIGVWLGLPESDDSILSFTRFINPGKLLTSDKKDFIAAGDLALYFL